MMRIKMLLPAVVLLCAAGCADPDPERDRVLAAIAALRPEMEAAIGDSLGDEIEVLRIAEEDLKEKMRETVLAVKPDAEVEGRFDEAWESTSWLRLALPMFGDMHFVFTDAEARICFVDLPESDEKLRKLLERELLRVYQIRALDYFAFRGADCEPHEQLARTLVLDAQRGAVEGRLADARGEPRIDRVARIRDKKPRHLLDRIFRAMILEGEVLADRTDRYVADRCGGVPSAAGWKQIFASPPKSIWEIAGLRPEGDPAFDLAVSARAKFPETLSVSPVLPCLPGAAAAALRAAGSERSERARNLIEAGYQIRGELGGTSYDGNVRVLVLRAGDAASAAELAALWLDGERVLDAYAAGGEVSNVLLQAIHEPVSVGSWQGTRIRRLEEDHYIRIDPFYDFPPQWMRPEMLILSRDSSVLVLDLQDSSEFTVSTVALARLILGEGEPAPWPAFPEPEQEQLHDLLSRPDPQLRRWSLCRIADLDGQDWIPPELLLALLDDEDIPVRAAAFRVLAVRLLKGEAAKPELRDKALANCVSEDAALRASALQCLGLLPTAPSPDEQVFTAALEDPVATVRYRAVIALLKGCGEDEPPPASIRTMLTRMARDPVELVRELAESELNCLPEPEDE